MTDVSNTNGQTDEGPGKKGTRRKIYVSAAVSAAIVLVLAAALPAIASVGATQKGSDPTQGYNIHVSVGRHDSMNLHAQMDHYCKLDTRIVAVCQLYATDNNAKPGTGPQLSQIEFIITDDQYKQLPLRERQNWHNHAVELTPQRGNPSCINLPDGLTCDALLGILKTTYGKVITIWDPADALPSYEPYVFMVDSPFALGQDANNNLQNESPTGCGDKSSVNLPCEQVSLKVKALGPNGEDRPMFIRIAGDNGTKIISEGFSPFVFKGEMGKTYQVRATNFDGFVFDHWGDNGSTTRHRMLTLNTDTELTAHYTLASTKTYTANMSGSDEVPPVQTQATGMVKLKPSTNVGTLSFNLTASGIHHVTAAHLHLGAKGVNGPIVAFLYNNATPSGDVNGVLSSGTITAADLKGPLAGKSVADLVDEIGAGNIYANVHTTEHSGGEMRGQVS